MHQELLREILYLLHKFTALMDKSLFLALITIIFACSLFNILRGEKFNDLLKKKR